MSPTHDLGAEHTTKTISQTQAEARLGLRFTREMVRITELH